MGGLRLEYYGCFDFDLGSRGDTRPTRRVGRHSLLGCVHECAAAGTELFFLHPISYHDDQGSCTCLEDLPEQEIKVADDKCVGMCSSDGLDFSCTQGYQFISLYKIAQDKADTSNQEHLSAQRKSGQLSQLNTEVQWLSAGREGLARQEEALRQLREEIDGYWTQIDWAESNMTAILSGMDACSPDTDLSASDLQDLLVSHQLSAGINFLLLSVDRVGIRKAKLEEDVKQSRSEVEVRQTKVEDLFREMEGCIN